MKCSRGREGRKEVRRGRDGSVMQEGGMDGGRDGSVRESERVRGGQGRAWEY